MIATIAHKELKALYSTPLAWIILGLLQALVAWLFLARLNEFLAFQPQLARLANPPGITEIIVAPAFAAAAVVLLLATPLLSMRLIAEERRNQTLAFLLSAPLTMTEIVLGKFLGLFTFLLVIVGMTALLALSLYLGGALDIGLLLSNCLGLALLCAAFAAVGLFVSSLTAQPVTAAFGTLAALLACWLITIAATEADSPLNMLSLLKHFESFNKGIIDTADLAWFTLFTLAFLVLTIRRLDRDRLHG